VSYCRIPTHIWASHEVLRRVLGSLEIIALSFLEQIGTSQIELALVSRLKDKEKGYNYFLPSTSSLELFRQFQCPSSPALAEEDEARQLQELRS